MLLMNKCIRKPITEAFLCIQFIFCAENNETTVANLCHAFPIHHVYATYTTHIQHLLLLSAFPIRGRHSGFSISSYSYIFCNLLRHSNLSHVLFHHVHKPPFLPSPFPLSWQLHPQHSSPIIPIIFPPYMSIPPQSCLMTYHLSQSTHSQHTPCILNIHHVHSTYTKYVRAPCTLNMH